MRFGILSRNAAVRKNMKFLDISEEGVQDRRSGKKVPGTNKVLHDYANLYFDAHNPMLSARRSKNNEICVLRIKGDVLDLEDAIITDKNAARGCWFKTVAEGLPLLDRDEIYATFWLNDDHWEQERLKGIKCAEVLLPNEIRPDYIFGAYVANQTAFDYFGKISDLPVEIRSGLFF
jgi:hypothetical protein